MKRKLLALWSPSQDGLAYDNLIYDFFLPLPISRQPALLVCQTTDVIFEGTVYPGYLKDTLRKALVEMTGMERIV